jgi:hypothetical protein
MWFSRAGDLRRPHPFALGQPEVHLRAGGVKPSTSSVSCPGAGAPGASSPVSRNNPTTRRIAVNASELAVSISANESSTCSGCLRRTILAA